MIDDDEVVCGERFPRWDVNDAHLTRKVLRWCGVIAKCRDHVSKR